MLLHGNSNYANASQCYVACKFLYVYVYVFQVDVFRITCDCVLSSHFAYSVYRNLIILDLNTLLTACSVLRPLYTMKSYKNWCNAMTSASKMVDTMSKSSVRYVHQMAMYMVCSIFLFLLNSPSELTFWITYAFSVCSI